MTPAASAEAPGTYRVSLTRVDITPTYSVRLSGFGFRRTESEGIAQRTWAKRCRRSRTRRAIQKRRAYGRAVD